MTVGACHPGWLLWWLLSPVKTTQQVGLHILYLGGEVCTVRVLHSEGCGLPALLQVEDDWQHELHYGA